MYIVNPFKKKGKKMKMSDLSSTHPPISERIKILHNMMHGASFKDYSDSFGKVTHTKTIIPPAALAKEEIALRQASAEAGKKQRLEKQMHQIGDIMRKVNGFLFLTCTCGLNFKIPPNYKKDNVTCPKCQTTTPLPQK
jgi:heat shock protein HtpX